MRVLGPLTLGAALVACPGVASAKELPAWNPAVVCVPSAEEQHGAPAGSLIEQYLNDEPLCLVRLSPLFTGTSFELTPRATKKRWGAAFELRF